MNNDQALQQMIAMIKEQSTCVLATAGKDAMPHTSLMGYVADEDGRTIYMITPKNTRKFRNLTENPQASLLIRDDTGDKALTLSCTARLIDEPGHFNAVKEQVSALRPGLAELSELKDLAVVQFAIRSLLLLDGPVSSSFRELA